MVLIIFVTVNSHRVTEGVYCRGIGSIVEVFGYLMKPIDVSRLAIFLDKIIDKRNKRKVIEIHCNSQLTKIYQSDIVYIEANSHFSSHIIPPLLIN
jgi:hypothetical protein